MNYLVRAERWLFQEALPLWSTAGVDLKHGGYVEALTMSGMDAALPLKRTRVAGRQLYVFAHAAFLGWKPARPAVDHGIDFLVTKLWNPETGSFYRSVRRDGGPLDATPDLYDIAFALFGMAWAYRVTAESSLVSLMHSTLDSAERHLRHPSGLGFWNDAAKLGPRQQNPHMHLLEASLAAFEFTGEQRFKSLAIELVELFCNHLFDPSTNTLPELFDSVWRPISGDGGNYFEPGHQFEWAWILQNCQRILNIPVAAEIRGLTRMAEATGVDKATGLTFQTVSRTGVPIDRGSRSWPNTERIKAAVAMFELDKVNPNFVFESSSDVLFGRYLLKSPSGGWIDHFDADGRPTSKLIPASTLYHVFLAFAEALRVARLRGEHKLGMDGF